MSLKRLPPLNFLPAFEATGRLGSVKAAAAELHVTASAVSQQLKLIEEALDARLFERRAGSIRLTREGAVYLHEVQEALSDIARASQRVGGRARARVLRLSTSDFIAYEFLLPRLSAFRARFPGLELSFEATTRVVDFTNSDVDAAIRIGDGPWPGLTAHTLGAAFVTPVCSHELAEQIETSGDLRAQTLIEMRGQERRGWTRFLKKQGKRGTQKLVAFDSYLETMRAAEQGLGVALAVFPMSSEWVLSGRLSVPLAVRIPMSAKICLVHRETEAKDVLFARLTDWLREEYAALKVLPAGRLLPRQGRKATTPAKSPKA